MYKDVPEGLDYKVQWSIGECLADNESFRGLFPNFSVFYDENFQFLPDYPLRVDDR